MAKHSPTSSGAAISLLRVEPYAHLTIPVASPAVDADGMIDPLYAAGEGEASPPLNWTAVLEAESYVLIVEDPDAPRDRPVVHWMVWDIPGTATALPRDLGDSARPRDMPEAVQGLNSHGETGWMGVAPPPGDGVHRYHFQLFALSKTLGLRPDTSLEHLVEALKGVTLASGELVGRFAQPDPV